jgi:hypothetical protein
MYRLHGLFTEDDIKYKVGNSCGLFHFEPKTDRNKSDELNTVLTYSVGNAATEK